MLSRRAQRLLQHPAAIVQAHLQCESDPYSAHNPTGYLNFGTAQNLLMDSDLVAFFNALSLDLTTSDLHYADSHGQPVLRQLIADFYQREFQTLPLTSDNVILQTGASAICESLSFSLLDEGEGVLIPTPYYPGFDHDVTKRFQAHIVPVHRRAEDCFQLTIDQLDQAAKLAQEQGIQIRAILLTNPDNPTGIIYDTSFLKDVIEHSKKRGWHLLVDEIYAKTVFGHRPFVSALHLASPSDTHVHVIYGLAKDFCLSGFKTGIFVSRHPDVLKAMEASSYFHTLPNLHQRSLIALFEDRAFLDHLLQTNKARVADAYALIAKTLAVDHVQPSGGIFLFANLNRHLSDRSFESELRLHQKLLHSLQVSILPGQFFGTDSPGWFRICFARPQDHITALANRLNRFD